MDEDGYPEDDELKRLSEWPYADVDGLLLFVRELWHWPQFAECDGDELRLVTGGWSGNESVIGALKQNMGFWAICWESSHRGGLHVFNLSRLRKMGRKTCPSPQESA